MAYKGRQKRTLLQPPPAIPTCRLPRGRPPAPLPASPCCSSSWPRAPWVQPHTTSPSGPARCGTVSLPPPRRATLPAAGRWPTGTREASPQSPTPFLPKNCLKGALDRGEVALNAEGLACPTSMMADLAGRHMVPTADAKAPLAPACLPAPACSLWDCCKLRSGLYGKAAELRQSVLDSMAAASKNQGPVEAGRQQRGRGGPTCRERRCASWRPWVSGTRLAMRLLTRGRGTRCLLFAATAATCAASTCRGRLPAGPVLPQDL